MSNGDGAPLMRKTKFDRYLELKSMTAHIDISPEEVQKVFRECNFDLDKAFALILEKNNAESHVSNSAVAAVKRTTTSTGGARISVDINMAEVQPEPRVSVEEVSQETQAPVPEISPDSQTLERVEESEPMVEGEKDHEKHWKDSEPQVSVPIGSEEGSQETLILVPETPLDSQTALDSQTLERVEELVAMVEVKEEPNVQLGAHEQSGEGLGDIRSQPEPQITDPIGSEEGSHAKLPETPLDSQILERAEEPVAMVVVKEEPNVQSEAHQQSEEVSANFRSQPEPQISDPIRSGEGAQAKLCLVPETPLDSQPLERVEELEAMVVVKEEPNVHLEEQEKSEAKPKVPEVEMVDLVHETPLKSQPVQSVADTAKAEVVCKLESVSSMEEPEVQSTKKEVEIVEGDSLYRQKFRAWKEEREKARNPSQTQKKPVEVKKEVVEVKKEVVVEGIENGNFQTETDWLMVGDGIVTATSTTKRRRIENNEVVEFEYPAPTYRAPPIVRVRNKRLGEIGRLPMEWSKCLIPLVQCGIVKVRGKCVSGPLNLDMMRDIMLYMGFYAHKNFFAERENRISLKSSVLESNMNPLRSLFQLLKIQPLQEALCTAEDLVSQKRKQSLDVKTRMEEVESSLAKRRKVSSIEKVIEQKQDESEKAISEAALNKLIGTVEAQNLEEMEPPRTLTCDLRPYQKQALHWMSSLESVKEASKTLHPCWAAYQIKDENPVYVNVFSGEMVTKMPSATESARGGILADAMGLGKTVMTISLILARRGKGIPDDKKSDASLSQSRVNGGTLIICPMALLGQWKDEFDTHAEPDTLSVYVQYGAERTYDPRVIAKHDVVLTTYNLISNAFRNDGKDSIYYKVNWHRIVLDEAHTIKAWKTQTARSVFELSSNCRWCLTGTPLQNNLEDLFSLICFLKVEPWCNWNCWRDQIQRPYESGDPRGLSWVKAILKPLMLRRTKETKDKEGRLILELPPTDIQTIVCEQSEAERDFYLALFKRSKVQFDQFVAQGRVLHNYANILELLLRLRQCCNHPFLIMSRADSERYADLDKLARRFTELQNSEDQAPSKAYVEEVVEGIRRGETSECPICLESPDDPVLTSCAHRMCRECLFKSWRASSFGPCPICRNEIKKVDLITCPSEGRFSVDVEKNWKEAAKVSKLLEYLEEIRSSGSGEKSIVFSQWTAFLNLLEIPLKKRGFGFLRFDGKLSQKQRYSVLKEFDETQHKTVLLMSLKAGGVGLNLTAASNVFLMDPWWNPAVEEQAIMRIHRIGQKRTVVVRRFIVKDTVEERLEQVKARKQQMIAGALTDQEVRSVRLEDLKMLFR